MTRGWGELWTAQRSAGRKAAAAAGALQEGPGENPQPPEMRTFKPIEPNRILTNLASKQKTKTSGLTESGSKFKVFDYGTHFTDDPLKTDCEVVEQSVLTKTTSTKYSVTTK